MVELNKSKKAILGPIITYKTTQLAQKKCYTFEVRYDANKFEIAQEFEALFKGKATRVNTTADRTHRKRTKKGYTLKADRKKAYIYSDVDLDVFPKLEA